MLLYNAYIYLSGIQNMKICQCSDAARSILYGDMHMRFLCKKNLLRLKLNHNLKLRYTQNN